MTVLDCECAHLGECMEKTGGEQSMSAEEWEITRLRNLLRVSESDRREAEHAAAQFERSAAFWEEQTRRYRVQLELAEVSLQAAALELARGCR